MLLYDVVALLLYLTFVCPGVSALISVYLSFFVFFFGPYLLSLCVYFSAFLLFPP